MTQEERDLLMHLLRDPGYFADIFEAIRMMARVLVSHDEAIAKVTGDPAPR